MNKIYLSVRALLLGMALSCAAPLHAQTVVVMPYLQPGENPSTLGSDSKRIHWFTDQKPADFIVEYQLPGGMMRTAKPTRSAMDFTAPKTSVEPAKDVKTKQAADKEKKKATKPVEAKTDETEKEPKVPPAPETDHHYFKYSATLDDLPFNADVTYRVKVGGKTVREAVFRTRPTADKSVRCVLVGDMAQGRPYQHEIAYRISYERPEFLVALGDIVYPTGRVNHYMHYFWNTYNNPTQPDPKIGAPLMAGVTFYPVLGNHDISARLAKVPDALGTYYFFTPPKNGPGEGPWVTPLDGDASTNAKFRAATRDSYPYIDAYSFDYGPAHIAVINVNPKMDLGAPVFRKWLQTDLQNAGDRWKLVCYHMPAFHSSIQHYAEQQAHTLSPLFEETGVSMTFAGHVHNYQRTVPVKFLPDAKQEKKGRFDGEFALDTSFDGKLNTTPRGVIHIVAGGGGASLYRPGLDKTADVLKKTYGANFAAFTTKTVVDQHSFVVLDLAPNRLEMRAISINGKELDAIAITKGK